MNSRWLKLWLLSLLLLTMLTACSNMLSRLSPPQPIATSELEGLLQYYDSLREKPIKELAGEYDRTRQNFSQDGSNADRARLILLLTLPNTSFHSTTNALNLLNEWPKNTEQSPSLDGFKSLLTLLLTEQQRAGRRANESLRKLKEEQNRAEILRNKVNDIKSMEKNLILRRKN